MNSALELSVSFDLFSFHSVLCDEWGLCTVIFGVSAWDFEKDKRVRRKVELCSASPCCCDLCSLTLLPDVWGYTERVLSRDYHHSLVLGYCGSGLVGELF